MPASTPLPATDPAFAARPATAAPRQASISRPMACALLFLAAFFWGSGNVANKTVLQYIDPYTAVALRCLIAALVIMPFRSLDARCADHRAWLASAVRVALLFAGGMVLQQVAYQSTTVTNASFLVNTASILTPLVAWALLGDRPPLRILGAGLITLGGAFLMSGVDPVTARMNSGDLACLAAALLYAGWMVALGQHAARFGRPFATSFVQFVTAAVVVAPVSLAHAPTMAGIGLALPQLLILGVFSTGVAFALQTFAQRYVNASTAAILVSAESLFGAAGAYLLLNERTATSGLLGAALILFAIVMVATAPSPAVPSQPNPAPADPDGDTGLHPRHGHERRQSPASGLQPLGNLGLLCATVIPSPPLTSYRPPDI